MLKLFKRSMLPLIFLVFGSDAVWADTKEVQSILLIVADHSDSMHTDLSHISAIKQASSHMAIQTAAISAAVNNYLKRCASLSIGYIMWGDTARGPEWVDLDQEGERVEFLDKLRAELSRTNLIGTNHQVGWNKALAVINEVEWSASAIVFITDQAGRVVLTQPPPDTVLYKVGIETNKTDVVGQYLTNSMVANSGTTYSVHDDAALAKILDTIFHKVDTSLCIG
ncbi:MAG: hypothetical protein RLZZ360_933 [Candidatus Parcubacteria bacterium]|jgi:hypothetical protein